MSERSSSRDADPLVQHRARADHVGHAVGRPEASAHFSRFKVTEIAISDASDRQFDEDKILRAAELLDTRRSM